MSCDIKIKPIILTGCRRLPDCERKPKPISIDDFHIGFWYEEYQMDSERYLNKGMIWVKKQYGFNSPRLFKIEKLIKEGKIRRLQNYEKEKFFNYKLYTYNICNCYLVNSYELSWLAFHTIKKG